MPEPSSDWTIDTMHIHLLSLISAIKESTAESFRQRDESLVKALAADKIAVGDALDSQDKAVLKAEAATDKQFADLRSTLTQFMDRVRDFLPREEANIRFGSNDAKLGDFGIRLEKREGKDAGGAATLYMVGLIISIVINVVVVFSKFGK